MNGILKRPALIASLFLVASGAYAQPPLYVAISQSPSSSTFTSVTTAGGPPLSSSDTNVTVSRTTTSTTPISDEIDQTIPSYQAGAGQVTKAIANTGYFGVSDSTGWGFANASATSQLYFSPLADETTSIGVQIVANGDLAIMNYLHGWFNHYWSI